jgi:hypothetical protein
MNSICVPCMVRCRCPGHNLFARGSGGTRLTFLTLYRIPNESHLVLEAMPYRISSEAGAARRVAHASDDGEQFHSANLAHEILEYPEPEGRNRMKNMIWPGSNSIFSLSWHILSLGCF